MKKGSVYVCLCVVIFFFLLLSFSNTEANDKVVEDFFDREHLAF